MRELSVITTKGGVAAKFTMILSVAPNRKSEESDIASTQDRGAIPLLFMGNVFTELKGRFRK
jgi:hypothetical protein